MFSSEVKALIMSMKRNIRSVTLDEVEFYDPSDHIFAIHLRVAMEQDGLKHELYYFYRMVWIQMVEENNILLFEHKQFRSPPLYLFISREMPDDEDFDLNEDEARDNISEKVDELFSRR